MDNQHVRIKGYRDLTEAEINLMNEIKALGPVIEAVCDKVRAHIEWQISYAAHRQAHENDDAEQERLAKAEPEKWERWGRDGMQLSLMQLTRAVAQPTSF